MKESVPDAGDCTASALSATCLKLSADAWDSETWPAGMTRGNG